MSNIRTPLEALVLEKSLALMAMHRNAEFIDYLDQTGQADEMPVIKNVCAKVPVWLSDEIDGIVSLLGISKRRFLEAAFIDALDRANKVIDDEGLHDYLAQIAESQEAAFKESQQEVK